MSDNHLLSLCKAAQKAKFHLASLTSDQKSDALHACARGLVADRELLLAANEKDWLAAKEKGMSAALLDRLKLTPERILTMAEGMHQVADLPDPISEVLSMQKRPNGMILGQQRVPLGVVGIIFESRPNVCADAFALCFKSGNVAFLRGAGDCIHSNIAISESVTDTLKKEGITPDALLLLKDTSRETAKEFMRMREYIDVLIPRGSAGLIRAAVENSLIPVIETGTGNCHIFVDETADLNMAADIIVNAKTQRIGACNACESLVIHENVLAGFLPVLRDALAPYGVEIRGDEQVCSLLPTAVPATKEDWGTEYLAMILSIKTVASIDEAIAHINRYNTKHSDAIVTSLYEHAQRFLQEVDAACVYVNASTRFSDGFEFGFGAEIGISTQKLHARGPMGLTALTTTKYIIYGNGQIRS